MFLFLSKEMGLVGMVEDCCLSESLYCVKGRTSL